MLLNRKNRMTAYLLILPAAAMLAIFVLYPMILNISLSFKDYSMLKTTTKNVGLKNYVTLLSDKRVWEAVQRTFVWTFINVAGALIIGLGAAMLLSNGFKGSGLIKAIVLIPWVLPSVITGYIWSLMLQEDAGVITYILKTLGLVASDFSWFRTGPLSMSAAIMANIWRAFPFFTLMIYAKINTIPSDHIEAAMLEGANSIQLFRHVTFPFIRPTVYTCTYLCFIWSFNAFDILKVMTNGGPAEMTTTMSIMVQREAFQFFEISNASTMSVIMFVLMISVIVIFTLASRLVRRVKK